MDISYAMAIGIIVASVFGPGEDLSAEAKKAREKDYHEFLLTYFNRTGGEQRGWTSYGPASLNLLNASLRTKSGLTRRNGSSGGIP